MNDYSLKNSELINAWLDGSITSEQADQLADLLEKDPEAGLMFRDNALVDFILRERYGTLQKVHDTFERNRFFVGNTAFDNSKDPNRILSNGESTVDAQNRLEASDVYFMTKLDARLLDELIRWERSTKPLHQVVIPVFKKNRNLFYRSLRYWFVPRSFKTDPTDTPNASERSNRRKKIDLFFYCARLVLLTGFIGMIFWAGANGLFQWRMTRSDDTFQPLAKVAELVDAEWEDGCESFKRGQETGPNELFLKSGLVRLDFHDGARVILEGPARFVINGPSNVFCREGKIHAHVPQEATGFRVITPFADFIDRGTDFSVSVNRTEARLDVIKGKVDIADSKGGLLANLCGGTASRIDSLRKIRSIPVNEKLYIGEEKFFGFLLGFIEKKQQINSQHDLLINRDPHLAARFDLTGNPKNRTVNVSKSGKDLIPFADFVQCSVTDGVLHGSKSTLIKGNGSRIEFETFGKYKNMTMMAQIRIDRLDHPANILACSEQFLRKEGAVLWQITQDGTMQVFIEEENRTDDNTVPASRRTVFQSPRIFPRNLWGTWMKIAVVFDAENKQIRQYTDGHLVSKHNWPAPVLLQPGLISLGNETGKKPSKNPSFLKSAWSEFRLYDSAQDGEKITN